MNDYKINSFDHCELYVSNAKQAAHYYRSCLGFQPIGYKGLETGSRDKVSYVMKQNQVRFVLSSPLAKGTEMGQHIDKHGDGVKDISFSVDNAENAWKETTSRGAESVSKPTLIEDEKGEAVIAASVGGNGALLKGKGVYSIALFMISVVVVTVYIQVLQPLLHRVSLASGQR